MEEIISFAETQAVTVLYSLCKVQKHLKVHFTIIELDRKITLSR